MPRAGFEPMVRAVEESICLSPRRHYDWPLIFITQHSNFNYYFRSLHITFTVPQLERKSTYTFVKRFLHVRQIDNIQKIHTL
jgi:hypothetical protein